jgi:hypothetical protein
VTGEPGRTHGERGRRRIEEWLDEKAAWGFSEWHSDVYYAKDVEPLLLLAEFADRDLAERAAAMLDVVLYDLALHQVHGNVGVTHGRSYMKDKSRAADQDVFAVVKLAFGTSDQPYPSRSDAAATALAAADRYRLPVVLDRVAHNRQTFVDREHMGVPLDLDQPFSTDPPSPVAGVPFTDPDSVPFWWERGALTAWQLVPLTLATIEQHDLWDIQLLRPYRALADAAGGDPAVARQLAHTLRCQINIELLTAVDTVTWRTPDAMLSSVQDYRPGCFGRQYHAWQATLDEDAVVFATNPGNEPRPRDRWVDADLYWNGGATMPRTAQHGAAVINLYAPQYQAAAVMSPCGRGARPTGARTTRPSRSPTGSPSRSTSSPPAAPTTCGSPRWATPSGGARSTPSSPRCRGRRCRSETWGRMRPAFREASTSPTGRPPRALSRSHGSAR